MSVLERSTKQKVITKSMLICFGLALVGIMTALVLYAGHLGDQKTVHSVVQIAGLQLFTLVKEQTSAGTTASVAVHGGLGVYLVASLALGAGIGWLRTHKTANFADEQ